MEHRESLNPAAGIPGPRQDGLGGVAGREYIDFDPPGAASETDLTEQAWAAVDVHVPRDPADVPPTDAGRYSHLKDIFERWAWRSAKTFVAAGALSFLGHLGAGYAGDQASMERFDIQARVGVPIYHRGGWDTIEDLATFANTGGKWAAWPAGAATLITIGGYAAVSGLNRRTGRS